MIPVCYFYRVPINITWSINKNTTNNFIQRYIFNMLLWEFSIFFIKLRNQRKTQKFRSFSSCQSGSALSCKKYLHFPHRATRLDSHHLWPLQRTICSERKLFFVFGHSRPDCREKSVQSGGFVDFRKFPDDVKRGKISRCKRQVLSSTGTTAQASSGGSSTPVRF